MLAGVSHDLRTPLTRLRLALAMLPRTEELSQDVAEMTADVEEMERMIGGYLAFARGEGDGAGRSGQSGGDFGRRRGGRAARRGVAGVEGAGGPDNEAACRRGSPSGHQPCGQCAPACEGMSNWAAQTQGRSVLVTVDDDGPGIPADKRESVFRPFESGSSGGTGLGLTIARDIVRAHGGEIVLEDSPLGGLRARIRLPV